MQTHIHIFTCSVYAHASKESKEKLNNVRLNNIGFPVAEKRYNYDYFFEFSALPMRSTINTFFGNVC